MAITAVGFDGTVTEAQWSKIMRAMGYGNAPTIVTSGFDASVGAGTRAVAVSAGEALVAGVLVTSTAVETLNASANATGSNRQDWLVLKIDWAANTAVLQIVAGTASLPALTQTAGTTWQMPLARITVGNGATTIPAANIDIRKPVPRFPRISTLVLASVANLFATSAGVTLGTVNLTDPGWAYRVEVVARVRARYATGTAGGALELAALLDGVQFGAGISPAFTATNTVPVDVQDVSGVQTGPCRIDVVASPNAIPSPGSVEIFGSYNKLIVKQIPV